MDATFSLGQLLGVFLGACGVITATAAASAVIISIVNKLKAPDRTQNERLDKHEEWLKKHDAILDSDHKRLKALEEGTNITLKALLALLRHGIDGNDVDSMKVVRDELQRYLIGR